MVHVSDDDGGDQNQSEKEVGNGEQDFEVNWSEGKEKKTEKDEEKKKIEMKSTKAKKSRVK